MFAKKDSTIEIDLDEKIKKNYYISRKCKVLLQEFCFQASNYHKRGMALIFYLFYLKQAMPNFGNRNLPCAELIASSITFIENEEIFFFLDFFGNLYFKIKFKFL